MTHVNDILVHPRLWWMVKYRAELEDLPYKLSLLVIVCLLFFYGSNDAPFAWLPVMDPITEVVCLIHLENVDGIIIAVCLPAFCVSTF